ncbi:ferritin-like domain-containing protein, partial [Rhodococcus erythropolis]|nr:ferritin-like domain-containing protein [Rhodococcus erythropolis]
MTDNTATLISQLRIVLELTHTEIQIAETRTRQARTEAVRGELSQNADKARERAEVIEEAIRDLDGLPDIVGPLLGRATAMVKAMTEQAQPFDEAMLGDLALEHQLLDRARYLWALATASEHTVIAALAGRLITAHIAT